MGAPEQFNAWLESVQTAHGRKHEFVYHPHRYSHLRKHNFVQEGDPYEFDGLKSHETSGKLHFLHPISLLAPETPMPADFSLEARDTLTLYLALNSVRSELPDDVDWAQLKPDVFFSSSKFLRQQDILQYEAALKRIIIRLMSMPDSALSTSTINKVIRLVEDPGLAKLPKDQLYITPSPAVYLSGLMCLLVELHRNDCLVRPL